MNPRAVCRQLPLRLPMGAFFLNSGLSKWNADDTTAEQLHGFAAATYPFLAGMPPRRFVRLLAGGEIALGTALAVPVIPVAPAGAGLTAFGLGTLGLYLRTPGMRREHSLRPTEQGIGLAKDVWLVGTGLSLLVDGIAECRGRLRGRRGRGRRCRGRR